MGQVVSITNLSCEQVYNLWVSEPELIQILDLRDAEEYRRAHIPGVKNISPGEVPLILQSLGAKLAILIATEKIETQLARELQTFDNFVFMGQCHRWSELRHPLAGEGVKNSEFRFKELKGETMRNEIIFHQLFEPQSSTYTYIVGDKKSKEAAIIDPVLETVDRDLKLMEELGLRLLYVLDTHIHADHITGAGEIRKRAKAKTAVSQDAAVDCVDIPLEDGQELLLGDKKIKVIATPGHTNTCLTYAFEGMIFTGDALLIRSCGRTDFQQGSSEKLFHSVREKLFKLPEDTVIYPGHDYRGFTSSTIGEEKRFNVRLNEGIGLEDFKKIMSELKLENPKKIHEAVPANLSCGKLKDNRTLHPQVVDGIPEISVEDLYTHLDQLAVNKVRLVDVRQPQEYNNELGHIKGTELITLGPDLIAFLEKGDRSEEIVFVCRSGGRSGTAVAESIKLGYQRTINMVGGMIRWNEKNFPVERN